VSELLSMLVPLETLPGWPAAPDPTPLQVIGLLAGLPLLTIVIVFAIAKIGNMVQASRGTDVQVTDPLWVGGREVEANEDTVAIETGQQQSQESDVGGAGARW
jgi:hypothetical protein